MTYYVITMMVMQFIGVIVNITMIGRTRKPIDPGTAALGAIISLALIAWGAYLLAARS